MNFNECQKYIASINEDNYYSQSYMFQEKEYLPEICDIIESLELKNRTSVLDIGPGWGTLPLWYSKRFNYIDIMDIMPLNHWIKEDFVKENHIGYIEDSVFNTIDKKYDLISMTQVIPHLKWNPLLAIKNIHDALNDDGIFITCVLDIEAHPNINSTFGIEWERLPDYDSNIAEIEDTVTAMYSDKTLAEILQIFRSVEITRNKLELFALCRK